MAARERERRAQQRCVKNVGMLCTLLNGHVTRPVTLRNFSGGGMLFDTSVRILPGTYIVVRNATASDVRENHMDSAGPQYAPRAGDPDACSLFRSYAVAMVKRCERIDTHDASSGYRVAAETQILTDY